jgi:hypothetical protein
MLFKKNYSANFVSKLTKYWKNCPRKRKKHKMLYLTWKVGFVYYLLCQTYSRTIWNLFKTPKHSLQTNSKNYPDCWEKPSIIFFLKQFCFVCYKYPNLYDTIISFDMSCFHCAIWCLDAVLYYCVFELNL